nr:RHS repeat-associated core domain-containing protein [Apibacter adventoris]
MQYYYHADHLGSSSYITNLDAQIVQHVEYVPFGEVFIEERNQSWNTPYLFNGKELDEETGLYYYGARYYNPRESIFLSVDPLFEETMTPYQYTYQNPIKFTDPTGMEGEGVDNDYKLGSDGKITLDKVTNDESDRLIAENGDVISSNIRKGILSDGINIAKDGLQIENANDITNIRLGSFLLDLSMYEQKEISWGLYNLGDKHVSIINILPYENNTVFTSDMLPESVSYKGKVYDVLSIGNHTHPSFAKKGDPVYNSQGKLVGTRTNEGGTSKPSSSDLMRSNKASNNYIFGRTGTRYYNTNGTVWNVEDKNPITRDNVYQRLGWKKRF